MFWLGVFVSAKTYIIPERDFLEIILELKNNYKKSVA
jgi:hypothetical protein